MKFHSPHIYLLSSLLLLAGCSTDEVNPGNNGKKVKLTLALQPADHTKATRSNEYNVAGDLIRNAYVVMVNQNQVERIFHVTDTDEFERKQVTTIDANMNATYSFVNLANFADFSNITTDAEGNITSLTTNGLTFTVGSTLPSTLEETTYTAAFNNYSTPTTGLPMTNNETFFVDKDQSITLTLFRMMGKVQLTFNNQSDKQIRLRKVVWGDITANNSSSIYFMPKKIDGIIQCDFGNLAYDTTSVALFDCGTDVDKAIIIEAGKSYTLGSTEPLYVNESKPYGTHQGFPLTLIMDRLNEEGEWEADNREAVVQLDAIKRNYVALVNVNLTNYVLKLTANSYPPIGGYPTHVLEENGEFYVTFTGGGDFEITPKFYKYADRNNPERWISLNDTKQVQSYSLQVTGATGIFSKQPQFDDTTGEIVGTITPGSQGIATVKLTVNIITGTSSSGIVTTSTYTRTIYIIAQ